MVVCFSIIASSLAALAALYSIIFSRLAALAAL